MNDIRMFRILRFTSILKIKQRSYGTDRKSESYYDILKVSKNASKKEIRSAFLKLSKEMHPDKSSKDEKISHNEFVKINEAYKILSKDNSRQQYDGDLRFKDNPYYSTPYRKQDPYKYSQYGNPTWKSESNSRHSYRNYNEYYNKYYDEFKQNTYDPHNTPPTSKQTQKIQTMWFVLGFICFIELVFVIYGPSSNKNNSPYISHGYINNYDEVRARIKAKKAAQTPVENLAMNTTNSQNDSDKNIKW